MAIRCEYYEWRSSLFSASHNCKKKKELGERDTSVDRNHVEKYCEDWKAAKDCPYFYKKKSSGWFW